MMHMENDRNSINKNSRAAGERVLVTIGISRYAEMNPLQGPSADVTAFREVMEQQYGFRTMVDLRDEEAIWERILAVLKSCGNLNEKDTLVLYYAGHGRSEEYYGMNYWLPYDAKEKDIRSWIPSSMVSGAMENIPARHILLLNDSCFSGDLLETRRDFEERKPGYEQTAKWYRAREVMTSGMSEPVADAAMGGHSPFSYHLLDGLWNHDKLWIDARGLYEYVKRGVEGQTPLYGTLRGHQEGGACMLYRQRQKHAASKDKITTQKNVQEDDAAEVAPETHDFPRITNEPVSRSRKRSLRITFWIMVIMILAAAAGIVMIKTDNLPLEVLLSVGTKQVRPQQAALIELDNQLIPLTFVEGGNVQIGSNNEDSDEQPVHTVQVDSFYIGTYEVTQDIYEKVMGSNPSEWKGDQLPVEQVSWYDAVQFCNALSRLEGRQEAYAISGSKVIVNWESNGYRLPTESEWEYAARGGANTWGYIYAGSNSVETVAWYEGNSGGRTHQVGKKHPNGLGLYDMSGNVWEWCWDEYSKGYSIDSVPNKFIELSWGKPGVLRGGSWYGYAAYNRVTNRRSSSLEYIFSDIGFRVVVSE
ncbi:MAG: SUMF1/EgtB/PvdO family nonheme iron enzyme [Spirochaetia bacterium]|nr:SUMF1/EgtB/PvdO family nonheme iron enzyme [Spirochaetia bacterium]